MRYYEDLKYIFRSAMYHFYTNDFELLDFDNQIHYASEQCMVFHIAHYMLNELERSRLKIDTDKKISLDCEFNRNDAYPKMLINNNNEKERFIPDLIIHERKSNENNILVVELKKISAPIFEIEKDLERLKILTDTKNKNNDYKFKYGLLVILSRDRFETLVVMNGKVIANRIAKTKNITDPFYPVSDIGRSEQFRICNY